MNATEIAAAVLALTLGGCAAQKTVQPIPAPLASERAESERCTSSSEACREWTALAAKCDENMRKRDAGFMGQLPGYCDQAEEVRERATGIANSSDPGAYSF
jgi:hypothetical protein